MNEQNIHFWREDLRYLADQLRDHHANLYHSLSREQFDQSIAALDNRIPNLEAHSVIVELSRIVASIGDGHTSLWLDSNDSLGFQHYPLRFYQFSDGVFVKQTDQAHRGHLGTRLRQVGSTGVEEALMRIEQCVSGDNQLMRQYKACEALVRPEVLHALGLIDDLETGTFILETAKRKTVMLQPPLIGTAVKTEWIDLSRNETPLALWKQQTDRFYWFEYLEAQKTIYFNHRVVRHADDETFDVFCRRLFEFIETQPVEKLVIDLRSNGGGDNRLNQSLIHGLICCPKINQTGKLFTLIGRQTFSAAMNLAVDLERNTHTLFAGEPSGASPNHYGENYHAILPHSRITLSISMWYWQSSWPDDRRPFIEPQLPVAMSSSDYRNNRDPVLDTVLQYETE